MTEYDRLSLFLGIVGIVIIPLIVFVFKSVIRWTRVEAKLDRVIEIQSGLATDLREDRRATNERLQWLERGGNTRLQQQLPPW